MNKHWISGTVAAVLTVLLSVSIAYAALTFDATTVTSDAALTLTTAAGSNVAVTRGISFNSATSTDSLSIGGVTQLTGATASGTALVIGNDTVLFRNAANQLRLQGTLSVSAGGTFNAATTTDSLYVGGLAWHSGATASATALVIGTDVPVFRSAANTLTIQGTLALSNGETIANTTNNNIFIGATSVSVATTAATTTRSMFLSAPAGTNTTTLEISGKKGSWGSCIEMWQENVAYRVIVTNGNALAVSAGSCRD